MTTQRTSSRRVFLAYASAATAAGSLAVSTSGCGEAAVNDRRLTFATLDDALRELARLTKAEALRPPTAWTWPQTLDHCAQSIEFSMRGFPQAKSPVFQRTIGAAAVSVFAWRGRMSHDLAEPIPSAPPLSASTDSAAAMARLQRAIQEFRGWKEPLRPHFAYGELTKSQYEHAHAMHLANHFSVFDAQV